jgi:predicted nucleic acid-binding protein
VSASHALADTSVFIAREQGRPMLSDPPAGLMVSWITIAELRAGVLEASTPTERSLREVTLHQAVKLDPLPVDRAVAYAWARLRTALREVKRSLTGNDPLIAATAVAHSVPLVTQDRDYVDVPGLQVIRL